MPSFGEQFLAAQKTNMSVRALEVSVRSKMAEAFVAWEQGKLSDQDVRWAMERIVRDSYRSAAAVGLAHLAVQAGVPRWKPKRMRAEGLKSSYLEGLLSDVRRNLRDYKAGPREDVDKTRLLSRVAHSAGVAAARGQTDSLLRGADELVDGYGFIVRKVWRANHVNHTPCVLCEELDGTEVDLQDEFPAKNQLKVYGDLKGPPRHPRCMCWLVILIEGLETVDDEIDGPSDAPEKETMSTDRVKKMSSTIFEKLVGWMRKLLLKLRSESV